MKNIKNALLRLCILGCLLGLSACGDSKEQEPITIVVNYDTDYAKEAPLSQDDSNKIRNIFKNAKWDNVRTFDSSSYAFRMEDGGLFLYETEYGIFNDANKYRCFSVSDEQMNALGKLVEKYEGALIIKAVSLIGLDGREQTLSAEDSRKLSRILNLCPRNEGVRSGEYSCIVVLSDGNKLYYTADGGFNDYSNDGSYCDLPDGDKESVSEILERYGVLPPNEEES